MVNGKIFQGDVGMAKDTKTIGQIIGSRMRQQRRALGLTQEQVEMLSGG